MTTGPRTALLAGTGVRNPAVMIAAAALALLATACDSQGRPLFNIAVPGDHGFAPGRGLPASPPVARGGQVNTKISECERLEPAGSLLGWG